MPLEQINNKLSHLISVQTQLTKQIEKDYGLIYKALGNIVEILTTKLPDADKLMRVKEVVEMLESSRSTVYRLTEKQILHCTYIEGTPYYLRSDILAVFKKKDNERSE